MPIYHYECAQCFNIVERILPMHERDNPQSCSCGATMARKPTAGTFRMPGGSGKINYADAFTADVLGVPYNSLPPNLKVGK
jgi:putative FmdB family regulatory protein